MTTDAQDIQRLQSALDQMLTTSEGLVSLMQRTGLTSYEGSPGHDITVSARHFMDEASKTLHASQTRAQTKPTEPAKPDDGVTSLQFGIILMSGGVFVLCSVLWGVIGAATCTIGIGALISGYALSNKAGRTNA